MNSVAEPEKPRCAQLFAFSPIIRRFFRLLRTAEDVHPRLLVFGIINAVPRLRAAPCSPQISQRPRSVSMRSEERRVGKECVSTCRSRWSPYHSTKKQTDKYNYTHII